MSRPSDLPSFAVLLSRRHADNDHRDAEASLTELEHLLRGLGITVVERVVQRRKPQSSGFLGAGKQEALEALVEELKPQHGEENLLLAVDAELRPGQLHQLESALDLPVVDRAGVVLRVFEQRAQTPIARVEIEVARLSYEAPRVRHDEAVTSSEGGGGGRGGRGHTNVELEKRRIRERLAALRQELAALSTREEKQRGRRDALRIALVGYTNAGKSTVMRALTGADVLVEDKLFATLGSTVRSLAPPTSPPILVSDTVGFIRNLPHDLVASFRSTLAEARDAGLLLHVVDGSDPDWAEQMRVTRESIGAIGGADVPELVVLNKVDRLDEAEREALARAVPGALLVSALDPGDTKRLHEAIVAAFDGELRGEILAVPITDGRALGEIRSRARVLTEAWGDEDVRLAVRALPADIERWRHLVLERREIRSVDELLAAARRHGLELRADGDAFDGTGLDFRVAHATDGEGRRWILRTPRRQDVQASSLVEARVLALVQPRLPVAVPQWHVHAPDVIAYPRLEGVPAVTVDPASGPTWNVIRPGELPEAFVESLATALAALQAIPIVEVQQAGLPLRRIDDVRTELFHAIEATAAELRPPERLRARWLRWLDEDRCWPEHLALVHGDLHPGHLLLAPDGALRGILDWTEAQVTDPSVDFAMIHGCFGAAALGRIVARFEEAGGRTWRGLLWHAAERWAAFPVLAAAWALRTGNDTALEFARSELAGAR